MYPKINKVGILVQVGIIFLLNFFYSIDFTSAKTTIAFVSDATQSTISELSYNLRLVFKARDPTPVPPQQGRKSKILFCNTPGTNILDNNQNGVAKAISINDSRFIGEIHPIILTLDSLAMFTALGDKSPRMHTGSLRSNCQSAQGIRTSCSFLPPIILA
jgi:hypothetical protein